jgi:glucose/mannose-6-phosphate isomerase
MVNLDDAESVKKIDGSDMLKLLVDFPDQCARAKALATDFKVKKEHFVSCANILFTGLGGSAIGADLVRSYLASESRLPIYVNRNYLLPDFVSARTLVIASSYSGNTEETISAYNDAKSKGARMIAVTSGGQIARMASSDGIPLILIPAGLPPRCALGYSFFPNLVLMSKIGIASDKGADIDEAIELMKKLRDEKIGPGVSTKENAAKTLAKEIRGKFPVIYGGQDHVDSVVVRWRGQFAENSKAISSSHLFPEMNHNEIVGWQNPAGLFKKFIVILLRDKGDHPRTKRRMDITKEIIEKEGVRVIEIESTGKSLLARIFSLIYTGDFTSYYLALLYGVDPTPVDRVTYLKNELAKERR